VGLLVGLVLLWSVMGVLGWGVWWWCCAALLHWSWLGVFVLLRAFPVSLFVCSSSVGLPNIKWVQAQFRSTRRVRL
jgi:hypothetical protein